MSARDGIRVGKRLARYGKRQQPLDFTQQEESTVKITVTPGRKIMGRLAKGEDLLAALTNCAREHGITLGEVQAIGAVSQARVGYYNQAERKYYFLDLARPLEIPP